VDGNAVIIAHGLTKRYGKIVALRGVDLRVRSGECVGIVGPNGAGKTTLLNIISGRTEPTSGTLLVFGKDISDARSMIKERVGCVPQENNLDPELTVKENLELYARYFGMNSRVARHRAQELLRFVDLDDKKDAKIHELSGGMKRRLVIARSLVNDPELVVLDEPTTGLDPQARLNVWEKIRELKSEGRTLLLATHYMEEASRLCDRVAIFDEGRVVAQGEPSSLVTQYVGKWVMEIRDTAEPNLDAARAEVGVRRVQRIGRSVYIYADDPNMLLGMLPEELRNSNSYLIRSANLEDVFLFVTGKGLNV